MDLSCYYKEIRKYKPLTHEEEKTEFQLLRQGDTEAFRKLLCSNLKFVVSVAKQYSQFGVPLNELICEGNLGLIKAIKRFDESWGYKFRTYAIWWIRQSVIEAVSNYSSIVRIPGNRLKELPKIKKAERKLEQELGRTPSISEIAQSLKKDFAEVSKSLGISVKCLSLEQRVCNGEKSRCLLEVLCEEKIEAAAEQTLLEAKYKGLLDRLFKSLNSREEAVIKLCFGIEQEKRPTLKEISSILKISPSRVRQIRDKAIKNLRTANNVRIARRYLMNEQ